MGLMWIKSLFTSVAPALANATSVHVTPIPVEVDSRTPARPPQIAYEPRSGILKCTVQDDIGPTLAEFRDRLMASGWQISSHPDAPPQIPIADPSNPTRQSARLYFVQRQGALAAGAFANRPWQDRGRSTKVREAEMQTEFKARQDGQSPAIRRACTESNGTESAPDRG